jgi:hypothetical protein
MKRLSAVVMGLSIVSFGAFLSPTPVKAENCVNAAAKGGSRGSVIGGVAGGVAGAGIGASAGSSAGPVGTAGGAVGGAAVGHAAGSEAGEVAGELGAGGDCVIEEATGVSPYKESVEAGNEAVNEAEEQLRKLPF